MKNSAQRLIAAAGIMGALAVMFGAFGAHGLKDKIDPSWLAVYQTGVAYHFYHVMALGLAGILALNSYSNSYSKLGVILSGWGFLVGIMVFSGSLYLMALGGPRWLGMMTPLGGLSFIIGWIGVCITGFKLERQTDET